MRLLKILAITLMVGVALTAGIMIAAAVVLGGALIFLGRRLLRPSSPTRIAGPDQESVHRSDPDRVIEVSATEVPLHRTPR